MCAGFLVLSNIREVLKQEENAQDPLVLQQKRKLVDNGTDIKLVKKSLRRGGINWETAYPKGRR